MFHFVHGQMIFVLSILPCDSISELLQAFRPDAEFLSNCLLQRIVREQDKRFQSGSWVALIVDPP